MPFPFTKLPPELRDEVYRHALVPRDGRVWIKKSTDNTSPYRAYRGRDQVNSRLLQVCRTIYQEARVILYNEVEFRFYQRDSGKLILDFLLSRPESSLKHFRKIGLIADTYLRRWPGQPEKFERVDKDGLHWDEVCAILANKCDIKYLWLHVDLFGVSTHPMDKDRVPVPVSVDVIPAWADQLSQIHGLYHLEVLVEGMARGGQKVDQFTRKHIIHSLRHMQNNMLDTCEMPSPLNGSGLRIRETPVGSSRCLFQIEMSIDHNGYAHFWPEKTVKVRPDVWCAECGRFKAFSESWQWCRRLWRNRAKPCVYASDGNQWDSKHWGNRPMQEFLPPGVTMSDFAQAKACLEEGFLLSLHGVLEDCSNEPGGGIA